MNSFIDLKGKVQYLFKTGFVHIFGFTVVNKLLTFMSSILIVRIIPKDIFGIYTYANNLVAMFMLASGLGLVSSTFQLCSEHAHNKKRINRIYSYGSAVALRFNFLLSIIIIIFSIVYTFKFKSAEMYILLMAFQPFVIVIFEFQQVYLRSNLQNKDYAYSCNLNTIFVVAFSMLGALVYGVTGLIIGNYLAYILSEVIVYYKFKAFISFKKSKIKNTYKKLLYKIAFISMTNNGLSTLLYLVDIFIIGIYVTDERLIASYKVATVIPTAITFIPSAIITYVYPYFAMNRKNMEWTKTNYKILLKWVAILNVVITLGLIIIAKPLIITIYGKNYLDSLQCFRILVFSYFFSGTFRIISGNLLVTQRRVGINLFISIISGVLNIVFNIILIPKLGNLGAALTTTLIVLISSLFSTFFYLKVINYKR